MDFNNIEWIRSEGFAGFLSIRNLQNDISPVPDKMGVYFLIHNGVQTPKFIDPGSGGFFKGKDPNVPISELNQNWVSGANVVYIGKAGGIGSKSTLKKRLKQYMQFGLGKNIGHYGGRYIWQLQDSGEIKICWKTIVGSGPELIETEYLRMFHDQFNKLPFANLRF